MNEESKNLPKLVLFGVILLLLLSGIKLIPEYLNKNQKLMNDTQAEVIDEEIIESVFFEAQEDGVNAFELLQENAEVTYKEYDFGVFVESINGTAGNEDFFWAFYVNDEKANAGADVTTLNTGDKVEWRYEKVTY
jgi:lipopolysaccharide export LptBFGC system permease protein LptF